MSLLLIDDQGEFWDGQSRKLRQAFDSPYSGGEFSDYAVANLGFVALNIYGASCQVRLRPTTISERTHRAVRDWLQRSRNERIVLTWLDDDWKNELLRAGPSSFQRLDELIAGATRAKPHDFLSRLLETEQIPADTPLGELVRQWPSISAQSGQHALMHLLNMALGNRYVVVKQDKADGRFLFDQFGDGLFSDYETWRSCAVGAPMEEQPDRQFGRWVASAYSEALEKNRPQIVDVDAIVRWPHAGRARMRYKRVIVPLPGTGPERMLLGGSLIENRIDLRVGLR